MRKVRVNLIIGLVISALMALLIVQAFQTASLFDRKSTQFEERFNTTLETIALKHERAEEMRRYMHVIDKDFSGKYKDILKEEFKDMLSANESISIRDTTIMEEGEELNYLIIQGKAYDSISGLSTQQTVLARDVRQLRDLFNQEAPLVDKDSIRLAIQLDQRVIQQIFKKARFVNEIMLESFRTNVYKDPSERLDLHFLDTVIRTELSGKDLPDDYQFVLTDQFGNPIEFEHAPERYTLKLDTSGTHETVLFPGNVLDEDLFLHVRFPKQGAFVIKEMWGSLAVNFSLGLLIVIAIFFMLRTILSQKKLSEMKSDFISNMTHEFKTPISTISLACQAINDEDMMDSKVESTEPYVKMIKDENKRLEVLVERILQSATLDRGELQLKNERVLLNEVVEEAVQNAKFRISNVGGTIEYNSPKDLIYIECDRVHLANVISNLIDNAIKYSNKLPKVIVSLGKSKNIISLSVEDEGIGIKKEHLNKIFDNLYRIPTGNVHNVKGFGLGLGYVKAIIDLHEWKVNVKSKYGTGSNFTIEIKDKL